MKYFAFQHIHCQTILWNAKQTRDIIDDLVDFSYQILGTELTKNIL